MRHSDAVYMVLMVVAAGVVIAGCGREATSTMPVTPVVVTPAAETPALPDAPPAVDADAAAEPAAAISASPAAPGASATPASAPSAAPSAAPPAAPPAATPAATPAKPPTPVPQAPAPAPAAAPATPPAPAPAPAAEPAPAAPKGTVVIAKISVVSHVPQPSEVPYTECLTMIKYTVERVESGEVGGSELLAAFWGMRNAKLEPPARFTVGQRHRLVIEPLSSHPDLARVMQADDTNEYALKPWWVLSYSGA